MVILALIFFAVVGMASAAAEAPIPAASAESPAILAPAGASDAIGTTDGTSDAAPIGAPVAEGTFSNVAPAPSPKNGGAALEISAVAGVAATVAVVAFFF